MSPSSFLIIGPRRSATVDAVNNLDLLLDRKPSVTAYFRINSILDFSRYHFSLPLFYYPEVRTLYITFLGAIHISYGPVTW